MFNKKYCKICGEKVKKGWKYCAYCGSNLEDFEDIFEKVEKEFERIDKVFSTRFFEIPKIKLRPSGISITIKSFSGKPKLEIKTFGSYKKIEPEIKKRIYPIKEVEEIKEVKKAEEPETKIESLNGKILIQIRLPEVKNEKDIEIKKLEQSIEIKAYVKDKVYFKLIPIQPNKEIINKSFEKGLLKIELG